MTEVSEQVKSTRSGLTRFVMKAAGGTFLLRLFYLGSGFATTLLLTTWLGAKGLGVYNFVISWVVLAVIFVKFGFEDFLVRETASVQAKGDYATANRLWSFSRRFVLITATAAASCFVVALLLLDFENPNLEPTFWIGILMIPLLGLIGLYRGRFRANKRIVNSQIPEYLIRPVLLMLVVGVMLLTRAERLPEYAIIINVGATVAAFAFCFFSEWWIQDSFIPKDHKPEPPSLDVSDPPTDTAAIPKSAWIMGALPFVMIAGIHIINQRADRLMLGGLIDMEAVGFYSIAAQMAMVVNFPLLGINQAVGPLIAERHESKTSNELEHTLIRVTLLATAGSALIVLGLAFFGRWVLSFFEPEFQQSYVPMLILALGQLANVAAGPAGAILSMSREERFVGLGILISAIVNLILNAILIPFWGIVGASIATAVSMATWNILLVIFAKRKLGINANMWAFLVPAKPAS